MTASEHRSDEGVRSGASGQPASEHRSDEGVRSGQSADAILAELFTDEARANPYPHYRALHELGPISPLQQGVPGATPFAAIATGYDLVDNVLRDVSFYKKARPDWREHTLLTTFETSMMFSNPPMHGRMRNLFSKTFTPRRLASIDPTIGKLVDSLLAVSYTHLTLPTNREV